MFIYASQNMEYLNLYDRHVVNNGNEQFFI